MLYYVRTRSVSEIGWINRGTIVALTAARARTKVRKLLKLSKSVQIQAVKDGFPTIGNNQYKKSLTTG